MAAIDSEACASEQPLVSESHVDAPRRLAKRALAIGGLVALGFVAAFLLSKPQSQAPGDVSAVVGLGGGGIALCSDDSGAKKSTKYPCICGKTSAATKKCTSDEMCKATSDKDGTCKKAAPPQPPPSAPVKPEDSCANYECPEGLVKLLGTKALKKAKNDANCCAVCPLGWQPLGEKGEEAPGWGLSELGATAPSMSNCANGCKDNADCFSFKWHHTTKNCIFMSAAESTKKAQTSKWNNVITCVEADCTTTGLSTSGAGPNVPCVFPFRYKSKTYHNCTTDGHNNMNPGGSQLDDQKLTTWCATEVQDGEAVAGKWGHCSAGCRKENVLEELAEGIEAEQGLTTP